MGTGTNVTIPYLVDFVEVARLNTVSWSLLAAIAKVESNFDPTAKSAAGATGMMQMTEAAVKTIKEKKVADDPRRQIDQAAKYIQWLRMHTPPYDFAPVQTILAAYCWGVGNVAKYPNPEHWPEAVLRYVAKVQFWEYIYRRQKITVGGVR